MKRKKFIIPIAAVLASMTVLLTACGISSGGGSDSKNSIFTYYTCIACI